MVRKEGLNYDCNIPNKEKKLEIYSGSIINYQATDGWES